MGAFHIGNPSLTESTWRFGAPSNTYSRFVDKFLKCNSAVRKDFALCPTSQAVVLVETLAGDTELVVGRRDGPRLSFLKFMYQLDYSLGQSEAPGAAFRGLFLTSSVRQGLPVYRLLLQ